MDCIALVRCVLVLRCGLAGWCGIRMQAEALVLRCGLAGMVLYPDFKKYSTLTIQVK